MKNATMNGNVMFTGNDAAICASGCAMRATRGRNPIHTPIGVQISVAITLMATTRSSVSTPSQTTCSICAPRHVGPDLARDLDRVEDEPDDAAPRRDPRADAEQRLTGARRASGDRFA